MNNRAFTISFLVALMAVFMVYSYVESTEEQYKSKFGSEVNVVVAKTDIKELDVLDETNLVEKPVPAQFAAPGHGTKIEQFKGGLALGPIKAQEQITQSRVTTLGARTGLSRQVALKKRAITVSISDDSGVARLLKPGDRIDLLAIIDTAGGKKQLIEAKTIMQDVLVLATGKYVANTVPGIVEVDPIRPKDKAKINLSEYTNYANITLEVDPQQAQSLALIQRGLGQLYATLRNNDDSERLDIPTTRAENILGHPMTDPTPPAGRR